MKLPSFLTNIKRLFLTRIVPITLALSFVVLFILPTSAAVTITAATGGTAISVDTAPAGAAPGTTALNPITINEGAKQEITTGDIVIEAPAGFQFKNPPGNKISLEILDNTGAAPSNTSLRFVGGIDGLLVSADDATSFTFNISADSLAGTNPGRIVINNLLVQPTATSAVSADNITVKNTSTSTITGVTPGTTSLGSLASVAGTLHHYVVRSEEQGCTTAATVLTAACDAAADKAATATVGTAENMLVIPVDQYGNVTTGSATVTISATTGPTGGTFTPTTANTAGGIDQVSIIFGVATNLGTFYELDVDDTSKNSTGDVEYDAHVTVNADAITGSVPNHANLEVSESADITFRFTTANAVPKNGKIVITLPSAFTATLLAGAIGDTYTDAIGGTTVYTAAVSGSVVTLTGDNAGDGIAASTVVDVILTGVLNPFDTTNLASNYDIFTQDTNGNNIDDAALFSGGSFIPGGLTGAAVSLGTTTVSTDPGNITLDFTLDHPLAQDGKIVYEFGSNWTMPDDADANVEIQLGTFSMDHSGGSDSFVDEKANIATAVISGKILTITLDGSLTTASDLPTTGNVRLIANFTNDLNPGAVDTSTPDKITIKTNSAAGGYRDGAGAVQDTYTVGTITTASVTATPSTQGGAGTHALTFTPAHNIPAGGKIVVTFGAGFTIADDTTVGKATLTSGFGGATVTGLAAVSGSKTVTVTLDNEITAGALTITLDSTLITNPGGNTTSVDGVLDASEIDVKTTNGSDKDIDDLTNPVATTYTAAIVPGTVTIAAITTAAVNTADSVTVTFNSTSGVATDGKIVYEFGADWTAKGDDADLEAGSAEITAFTVNAGDQTGNTTFTLVGNKVTVLFGGAGNPTAGQTVVLTLASTVFTNPRSVITGTDDTTLDGGEVDIYTTTNADVLVDDLANPQQDITFSVNTLGAKTFVVGNNGTDKIINTTPSTNVYYTASMTLGANTPLVSGDKLKLSFGSAWTINAVADCAADIMSTDDGTTSRVTDDGTKVGSDISCASTGQDVIVTIADTIAASSVVTFRIAAGATNPIQENPRSVGGVNNAINYFILDSNDKGIMTDTVATGSVSLTADVLTGGSITPTAAVTGASPTATTVVFTTPNALVSGDIITLTFGSGYTITDTDAAADIIATTSATTSAIYNVTDSSDVTISGLVTDTGARTAIMTLSAGVPAGRQLSFVVNTDIIAANPRAVGAAANTLDISITDSEPVNMTALASTVVPTLTVAAVTTPTLVANTSTEVGEAPAYSIVQFTTPNALIAGDKIKLTFGTGYSVLTVADCLDAGDITGNTSTTVDKIDDDGVAANLTSCVSANGTNSVTIVGNASIAAGSVISFRLGTDIIAINPRSVGAGAAVNDIDVLLTDTSDKSIASVDDTEVTLTAGAIPASYAVTVNNAAIGEAPGYYQISMTTDHALIAGDKITVSLGSGFNIANTTATADITATGGAVSNMRNVTDASDVGLSAVVADSASRTIILTLSGTVPATKNLSFQINENIIALNPLANTSQVGDTTLDANEIDVQTQDANDKVIDALANPEGPTYTAGLTLASMEPMVLTKATSTDLQVRFTTGSALPNNGKIVIDLPSTYAFGSSVVTDLSGIDGTFVAVVTTLDGTNDKITLTRQADGVEVPASTVVSFKVTNVTTPAASGSTGFYKLYLNTNGDALINSLVTIQADTITDPSDVVAPTLSSILPIDGAASQSITVAPTLTFNEALDSATITSANIQLKKFSDDSTVSASITLIEGDKVIKIVPNSDLSYATQYYMAVSTGVTDASGNAITATVKADNEFTTLADPSDTTAATLSSMSPADGATGVAIGGVVRLTFNEALDVTTVTSSFVELRKFSDDSVIASAISLIEGHLVIQIEPNANLEHGTQYYVDVAAGVKNAAGVAFAAGMVKADNEFTTVADSSDSIAPAGLTITTGIATVNADFYTITGSITADADDTTIQVLSGTTVMGTAVVTAGQTAWSVVVSLPQSTATTFTARVTDAANNAATAGSVVITEDGAVGVDSIAPAGLTITTGVATVNADFYTITGSITADADDTTIQVLSGTTVMGTAVVTAGQTAWSVVVSLPQSSATTFTARVTDSSNNAATGGSVVITEAADTTPPTVASTLPDHTSAQTEVDVAAAPSITFSKAIDVTTLTATNVYISTNAANNTGLIPASVTTSNGDKTVIITPTSNLSASTAYYLHVETSVKDTAGNAIAAQFNNLFSFTTQSEAAPTISALSIAATNTAATISWGTTNQPTSAKYRVNAVAYSGAWNVMAVSANTGTQAVASLTANTVYYYQVQFTKNGATTYSVPLQFTTARGANGTYVDSITVVKSTAQYDVTNPWTNGWHFRFAMTQDNVAETSLQMNMDNWVSGANTLATATNVKFLASTSGQSPNEATIDAAKNVSTSYADVISLSGVNDYNPTTGGKQFFVDVFVKIPSSSQAAGSYSTSYALKTVSDVSIALGTASINESATNTATNVITLTNDTFTNTSGTLVSSTDYTIAGLPTGITATVVTTSATSATITLTGTPTTPLTADSTITVTINKAALDGTIDPSSQTFAIADEAVVATPTPAAVVNNVTFDQTFTVALTKDQLTAASTATTIKAALTLGGTFAGQTVGTVVKTSVSEFTVQVTGNVVAGAATITLNASELEDSGNAVTNITIN
ncbi:hypothetical protein COB57_04185 [Candidatus Peregrinibacteria bacterium]|nr:MAG: hypothetical protein COB57_04185 [Candidatus Peregrinibacteria bacterium]